MMSNSKKSKVTPLGSGKYAIFENENGDGVIAYRPEGDEKDSHQVIPSGIFQLLMKAARGEPVDMNPMTLMKMLTGAKNG